MPTMAMEEVGLPMNMTVTEYSNFSVTTLNCLDNLVTGNCPLALTGIQCTLYGCIVTAKYSRGYNKFFKLCMIAHGIMQVNSLYSPFLVQSVAMQVVVQALAAQY
jgi:hypothetical protein